MIRLFERWWPPYLREEVRMLRLDLSREQRKYDKLRTALTTALADKAAMQVELDRMRLAAGAGVVRPAPARRGGLGDRLSKRPWPEDLIDRLRQEEADKRRTDGLGDPE